MTPVIVESPYAGDTEAVIARNVAYARLALRFALLHGFAPFASHLLYTQPGVLDDGVPWQRALGIKAGLHLGERCQETWLFIDWGISRGMRQGYTAAARAGRPYRLVTLGDWDGSRVGRPLLPELRPAPIDLREFNEH